MRILSKTLHPRQRPLRLLSPILLFLSFFLLPNLALTQVRGKVFDADDYPLAGATVKWENGSGTTVDVDGSFTLDLVEGQHMFTVSYLGFAPQTLHYGGEEKTYEIVLEESGTTLGDVTVTARDNGNSASVLKTRNVESISSKELRKAPCCSLAESFENSATVDLTYGDPLTGRREIQMLGLKGNYTMLTLEKRPMLDGLASPFALDLIPGPWVQGIQIGKGSGSLESGAQGMTGEINTELIKPVFGPKLFVNGFASTQGRGELNLLANKRIAENLYVGGAAHGSFTANNHDFDGDDFRDMPGRETGVGLLRLFKNGGGNWEGQWSVLGLKDYREGGQVDGIKSDPYQIIQDNRRVEAWGKTGFFGFRKAHQSLGTIYSASYHELNNVYGDKSHVGEQASLYFNGLYQTRVVNDRHQLSTGATIRSDRFTERLQEQDFGRNEMTIGAFGEYTYSWEEDRKGAPYRAFTLIAGLRIDEHNLGGTQLSPRLNVKYNPSESLAIRASGGRGWRSPNLLVDNLNWLPSSRQVTLDRREGGDPDGAGFIGLERAWNYGTNLTGHINVGEKELEFVLDAYRTVFTDQIIVDAEQDFQTLRLYQLDGTSRANSFLASLNYEVFPLIDVKLAYKYNDVRQTYREGGLREVPLTPKHRYLATVGYDGARLKAHLNYHYVGEQRLIDFDDIPASVEVTQPQRSPGFGLLSSQLTYVVNSKTQVYFGGENLTNVRQRNAIIGAGEPRSGDYFDATQVYQPIFGARAYVGFRYTVE